jgi:hypothetical protein
MCSTLMFGTLKLGLIDLQSAPRTEASSVGGEQYSFHDTIPFLFQIPTTDGAVPVSGGAE